MSLTDLLMQRGNKTTREDLANALALVERDLGSLRVDITDVERRLTRALDLIDATALTLHLGHPGQLATCLRGACVDLRKGRAAVTR